MLVNEQNPKKRRLEKGDQSDGWDKGKKGKQMGEDPETQNSRLKDNWETNIALNKKYKNRYE